ncbi:MAG: sodium:calcium antiporter, partial [Candidatus Binataceae bacterium]
ILIGAELFTNGVEWAGEKLNIAEAAVGSLLAAVGTALPETLIPAVALILGHGGENSHSQVGVGAIIGAPLMLSTVALFVMSVAAIAFRRRRTQIALKVSRKDARRDLMFFLPVFLALLIIGLGHPGPTFRKAIALALLVVYIIYSVIMLRMERSEQSEVDQGLYIESFFRGNPMDPRTATTILQVILGLTAIVFGALFFVDEIVFISQTANVNPGVLSLILSPLATELPEKYNSVVWIRKRKDHLALANITGAMVFQSCIPVALGVAYTPWHLTTAEVVGAAVALGSAMLLFLNLRDGELGTPTLMAGGVAYAIFIGLLVVTGVF